MIGVVVAAAAAGVAGALALKSLLDGPALADTLVAQVRETTGRDAGIDGGLHVRLWPRLAVVAEDLWVANAPGLQPVRMLQVRRASLVVALRPLLSRQVVVESVDVDGVALSLATAPDGRGNWQFDPGVAPPAPPRPPATAPPGLPSLHVAAVRLSDVDIGLAAAGGQPARTLKVAALTLADPGTPDGTGRIEGRLLVDGRPWTVEATTGRLRDLPHRAVPWPFDAALATEGLRLGVAGRLPTGSALSLNEVPLRIDVLWTKGQALAPWLPQGIALPLPLALQATIAADGPLWRIDPMKGTLAGQAFDGRLAIQATTPLRVDGRLALAALDLSPWWPAAPAPPSRPGAGSGTAAAPPPAERPLFAFERWPLEGRFELAIGRLAATNRPALDKLAVEVKSTATRFDLVSARAQVEGSPVAATGHVELQPGGSPRVAVRLDVPQLPVGVLRAATGRPPLPQQRGLVRISASLDSRGDTARALMSRLSGDLLVSANDVTIDPNSDFLRSDLLLQLIDALAPGTMKRDNVVQCAVVRLPFRGGVAAIDRSIAIETRQLDVVASGNLDLRSQTIELSFHPAAKKGVGLNPAQLAQFVKLQGPVTAPKLAVDLAGSARGALTIGAAVSTGGLSLLAERLLKERSDPHPCQAALRR